MAPWVINTHLYPSSHPRANGRPWTPQGRLVHAAGRHGSALPYAAGRVAAGRGRLQHPRVVPQAGVGGLNRPICGALKWLLHLHPGSGSPVYLQDRADWCRTKTVLAGVARVLEGGVGPAEGEAIKRYQQCPARGAPTSGAGSFPKWEKGTGQAASGERPLCVSRSHCCYKVSSPRPSPLTGKGVLCGGHPEAKVLQQFCWIS